MPRRSLVLLLALLASLFSFTAPVSAALPYVSGTETQPVYSYQNAIREAVYVQTPLDSDRDGKPDRVRVDIVRPSEAASTGVKVPVILEASPYYSCCGRGNEGELKGYAAGGAVDAMPLFYDNYFVPRGYAFAAVDLTGSNKSQGCPDVGGPAEILGAKAVVDWLGGRALGFAADGSQVKASWTTGRVGMIGKSWDGTIANGVAATGVQGLETIVPISAISSWYDYQRFGGVLRSPDYVDYLANLVNAHGAGCAGPIADAQAASDDSTGSYNAYWQARDYRTTASKVRASVFVVHGINDLNVTTSQFARWWDELAARGVPRKIWLSQQGHVDPFDIRRADWVDTLHKWFDYWLQKLPNGVMSQPQASVELPSGQWTTARTWPALGAVTKPVFFGNGDGKTGTLGGVPSLATRTFTDDPDLTEAAAVAGPNQASGSRAVFLSGKLTRDLRISGIPQVSLRVKVDKPTTELTVRLVDYGQQHRVDYLSDGSGIHNLSTESCWGPATATDNACYKDTAVDFTDSDTMVLTRGWRDAAHYKSLKLVTPLQPGRWYDVPVPMDAYDTVVKAGHVLGLVVAASDQESTSPTSTGATVQVSLMGSYLLLPSIGSLPSVRTAPQVPTAPQARTLREPLHRGDFR